MTANIRTTWTAIIVNGIARFRMMFSWSNYCFGAGLAALLLSFLPAHRLSVRRFYYPRRTLVRAS
jgi:uncharacterized protein (DUF58 family)